MVDTLVSGASASRRVGSTPISGTIQRMIDVILCFFLLYLPRFLEVVVFNGFWSNTYRYEDCIS